MKTFITKIISFARSGMTGTPNYAPGYIEKLMREEKPVIYLIGIQSIGGFEFRGASLSESTATTLFETVKTEVLINYQEHLNWLKEQPDVIKIKLETSKEEWLEIKKKVSELTIDKQGVDLVHPRPLCQKVYLS